jgi:phosphoglycolate phosphatase-like HAD superfamily hydrolase
VIRLALFDIDGTLIRTGGAGVKAFARAFAVQFEIPNATQGMSFAGRTDTSLVRECFQRHGIKPLAVNFQRFFETYVFLLSHLLHETEGAPCCGVVEFIENLQCLPKPPLLGLLTGNIRLGAEIKLRHYGLWDYFHCGAFGDDDENRNRLASVAHQRGEALLGGRLRREEILVVGDTPLDIECGRSIGAHVLAVATGGHTCDQLRSCGPTWAVPHLERLDAGAICAGADGAGRGP